MPSCLKKWTPIGARRIISQSGRSICKKILCWKSPLKLEHIKPRLLGHWGTTTGLNFLYVHLNRLIKDNDLNMIYVIGPGHGGPGIVAHTLSRRFVHGALSGNRAQPERTATALSPVLLALRDPQSRRRRKRPAQFTKAENSAIRLSTPMAPLSTIPI